jgi:hypothetical protein
LPLAIKARRICNAGAKSQIYNDLFTTVLLGKFGLNISQYSVNLI